jgi:hypothetical protein
MTSELPEKVKKLTFWSMKPVWTASTHTHLETANQGFILICVFEKLIWYLNLVGPLFPFFEHLRHANECHASRNILKEKKRTAHKAKK